MLVVGVSFLSLLPPKFDFVVNNNIYIVTVANPVK